MVGTPYFLVAPQAPKYAHTTVTTMASVRREKRGRHCIVGQSSRNTWGSFFPGRNCVFFLEFLKQFWRINPLFGVSATKADKPSQGSLKPSNHDLHSHVVTARWNYKQVRRFALWTNLGVFHRFAFSSPSAIVPFSASDATAPDISSSVQAWSANPLPIAGVIPSSV